VTEFLVELYVSRVDRASVEAGAERARRAAESLTAEGTPVRYLRSIFVPEDETCFYLYEAASVEAVREAARRAALRFERVAEAVTRSKGET
jgi:Nickel responsive protein SCO4226-like